MNSLSFRLPDTRFINTIYKPSIEKCAALNISNVFQGLGRGEAILENRENCDQYLAAYAAHHFHKLYAAFESTNFPYIHEKEVEIIDWGCGQALATCVLLDYLAEKGIKPKISVIHLIEPSSIAIERGVSFTRRMLHPKLNKDTYVYSTNKAINDLVRSDFTPDSQAIRIHLFSNILDVERFNLNGLGRLILSSFQGTNRFICVSPRKPNQSEKRIDVLYRQIVESSGVRSVRRVVSCSEELNKEVYYFKSKAYEKIRISRYEKQFTVTLNNG